MTSSAAPGPHHRSSISATCGSIPFVGLRDLLDTVTSTSRPRLAWLCGGPHAPWHWARVTGDPWSGTASTHRLGSVARRRHLRTLDPGRRSALTTDASEPAISSSCPAACAGSKLKAHGRAYPSLPASRSRTSRWARGCAPCSGGCFATTSLAARGGSRQTSRS